MDVIGPGLLLLIMFVIGPIAVFVVAGIWSAGFGWTLSDDADERAEAEPTAT